MCVHNSKSLYSIENDKQEEEKEGEWEGEGREEDLSGHCDVD